MRITKVRPSLLFGSLAVVLLFGARQAAAADTFADDFPSDDSTVVGSIGFIDNDEIGYFWSVLRGDSVTEKFQPGLKSVHHLDLDFEVSRNFLNSGARTDWNVELNGVIVGGWSWTDVDGVGPVSLSLDFAPITAKDGVFEVAMKMTNEVPPGLGSIALFYPGQMKMVGNELGLKITPEIASGGDTVLFETFSGLTGDPALTALTEVNGIGLFLVVALGTFDGAGEFTFQPTIGPAVTGLDTRFLSFAIMPAGHIAASNPATLVIQ